MSQELTEPTLPEVVATGINGLDELLHGGLPRGQNYLIEGESGSGKTTLGMQFVLEGARQGERVLLISMAEGKSDLEVIALSHGWSLSGVEIYEVPAIETARQLDSQQTVFPVSEVELSDMTERLVGVIRQKRPSRVVIDSITELRMLSESRLRFRRQMLALSSILGEIGATTFFNDRISGSRDNRVMDSLVHGIIRLERRTADYGAARRRLEVHKLRGMQYRDEWHDFRIETGGLVVYPQPRGFAAKEHAGWQQLSSGLEELDRLLGGGLELGSACVIGGASGTGKSTIANLFVYAALQQGIPVGIFVFDERPETLYKRTADLGMPLRPYVAEGLLTVHPVETGDTSPGEFAHLVRSMVENQGAKIVVIDSLTGYLRAMPDEQVILNQTHDLVTFLSRHGVLSLLIVTHHGLVGEVTREALDLSYLADSVVLLRHFEADGALRQAISVVKKRHSRHEKTIREIRIGRDGVQVSEPLNAFRGVLTGVPLYEGKAEALLTRRQGKESALGDGQ